MTGALRSHIPGRGRWRFPELVGQPELARRLEQLLGVHEFVERVFVNPATGSVLVFHPSAKPASEVDAIVSSCLAQAHRLVARGPSSPSSQESVSDIVRSTLPKLIDRAMRHQEVLWRFLASSTTKRLLEAAPPVLLGMSVDILLNPKTSVLARRGLARGLAPQLAILGAAGIVLWSARSWLGYQERVWSTELTQLLQHELRTDVYTQLQTLDMSLFDASQIGALSSIIDSDVNGVEGLLENSIKPFISLGANALMTVVSLALVSPRMLWIPAACVPVLLLLTVSAVKPSRQRYKTVHRSSVDFNSMLVDNIDGMSTIRAFGNEAVEAKRVSKASQKLVDATLEATRFVSRITPALEGVVRIGQFSALVMGGRQLYRGEINPGTYNSLAASVLKLLNSVAYIGVSIARSQRYLAALDRVFSVLEQEPRVGDGTQVLPTESVRGHVRFEHVNFAYGSGEPILRNISLEARGGETTAIIGSSGAGKTTLLKLLLRFYEPNSGAITLDGHAISDLRRRDLLDAIALVNQDTFLFHGSIRENISYGRPNADLEQVQRAASQAAAHEFILQLPQGYDTIIGHRGATLSGGQRQRIALARALLVDAPILALDEATSAIDSETEQAIQRSLMTTAAGRTRIVVAHRLATIRHADRIYVLHQGEVVEQGTHQELLALNRMYGNLWRIQTNETN